MDRKGSFLGRWIFPLCFLGIFSVFQVFQPLYAQRVQSIQHEPAVCLSALQGIVHTDKVDTLLQHQALYRSANPDMGYKVLVFSQSGNYSKKAALKAVEDFKLLYPEQKVYLSFEEPYFKVKVGNFTSRIKASLYLKSIKDDYPYAFVVKDYLDVPEYLKEDERKNEE